MIWNSEEARDEQAERAAEAFKDLQIGDAPPSALCEDTRPAWPWCAFGDLRSREDAQRAEDTWIYRADDDLPGDRVSVVDFRTSEGKVGYSDDILEFAADLKRACPADCMRLRLWMIADAMDPRSPGVPS